MTSLVNEDNQQSTKAEALLDGIISDPKWAQTKRYIITFPCEKLIVRELTMKDCSGTKKIIKQSQNPDSIEILVGGETSDSTILTTAIRTTGETPVAKDIFKVFKKVVVKHALKAGYCTYIYPGAHEKLKRGWRLTSCYDSLPDYNLTLDQVTSKK